MRSPDFADWRILPSAGADSRTGSDSPPFLPVLNETNLQIKALQEPVQIIGNTVIAVLPTTHDLISFRNKRKYLFLQLLCRNVSLAEAADKSGLSLEDATAYKDTPFAKDWLQKKELASIIAEEMRSQDNWLVEAHQVRQGEKTLNKGQMVVFQAIGERVAPKKPEAEDSKPKVSITFNFSPESVKEAFSRQASIDARIIEEQEA